jgi:ribosomal protein S6--L-glutamate ligase
MRVAFLLVRHPPDRVSPVIPEVIRRLSDRGIAVDPIYPDDGAEPESVGYDLCVLKAKTDRALHCAEALHARGCATLNPYPVAALCRDKIATTRVLARSGVPVPSTYVAPSARDLAPLLDGGPLIVKPYRGSQGRGIRVVDRPEDLGALELGSDPVMAQRYLPPDEPDHKIYRIGEEFFCVQQTWPPKTYADKVGRRTPVTGTIRELAERCGTALGIDLYGVDVIIHDGRPYVVDLSSFPGFKGVPDVARRLADYIQSRAERSGVPAVFRTTEV